jgi:hypothetical protein
LNGSAARSNGTKKDARRTPFCLPIPSWGARGHERLEEARQAPPRLSPHALRRTFASVMFALGEPIPVVMADGGWADPKVALTVYAHAMRRDDAEDAEDAALRALVEGSPIGSNGSSVESVPAPTEWRAPHKRRNPPYRRASGGWAVLGSNQ